MTCEFVEDLGMHFPRKSSLKKFRYFLVTCPYCKKDFKTQASSFKRGPLRSCRKCSSGIRDKSIYHRKHGLSSSPLYDVWFGMRQRCNNKTRAGYEHYGGRGISVCSEWYNDIREFYDWAISHGYKRGLDIDRIDNEGNYEPSNCRFVSKFVNLSNTRRIGKNNTSGFRGVSKYGRTGRFYAQIGTSGVKINLGVFDTAEQASKAYEDARKEKYKNIQ